MKVGCPPPLWRLPHAAALALSSFSGLMKQLLADAPRTLAWHTYDDRPLQPDELRLRVAYASPKHGSEIADFRGNSPLIDEKYDPDWQLLVPRTGDDPAGVVFGEWNVGNMGVGHVEECAPAVTEFAVGDRVVAYSGIRETAIVRAVGNHRLRKLPADMPWQSALCYDPAQFALGGIRDGQVRPGDAVVVMGLGAIGQLAVQMARHIGAYPIVAVDPVANRRAVAQRSGAHAALDPTAGDTGRQIKELTGQRGADVIIETSGSAPALQAAFRGLAYGGIISYVAWPKEFPAGLHLGREAHYNNARVVFSRVASEPLPDYPRWTRRRIEDTVWYLLTQGFLDGREIIQPVVPTAEAIGAYHHYVDQHPDQSIKLGIDLTGGWT